MIFTHVNLIQEGECALFYRFSRELKGYLIAGILVGTTMPAKLNFAKVWKYFVSEVVQDDDIYCSIMAGLDNNPMFDRYLDYHSTISGIKMYKIDNYLKHQHSTFEKQKERAKLRSDRLNKKQNTDHRGKPLS
jgi:hypothetical protein